MSEFQRRYYNNNNNRSNPTSDSLRRWFEDQHQQQSNPFRSSPWGHGQTRKRFYVNGIDVSHLFNQNNNNFFPNPFTQQSSNDQSSNNEVNSDINVPKSIFVEKVTVSLEDLYNGILRKEFKLSDGLWQRYTAAFRGGIATQIALQGLMTSAPLLFRTGWPVSLLAFLLTCHFSLPRPSKLHYFTSIKRGWKQGTKLKFNSVQPGLDIVFIIDEDKHDRFVRQGNDLKTTVSIGVSKARKGCNIVIEPLGHNETPVLVMLQAGEVTHDRQVVTVKGKGWPKSADGSKGDLLVTVNLVSDKKAKRRSSSSSSRKKVNTPR
mmetsp:Transcript_11233/g.12472  ORF Transcript_11233/g.12472 Transcript_11233/m.12472 type:complete len:319 (-) Transcript_11233:58-1014(-)